ncbi:uncharacterized protein LOC126735587 [Anthonomus grandis grandis]|uniref:uncharacterized protein LOC126735587 n=1 Tax=Anthonomus grandis grandis TaxID=2921223 RepID=UPI002165495B|nr:uncharacterized protein LOC126735587 [Anthonomus grandis grandis]XP_050295582.1 uncharacterized protein LOC126735587 [Anthonomus grandis grandis]
MTFTLLRNTSLIFLTILFYIALTVQEKSYLVSKEEDAIHLEEDFIQTHLREKRAVKNPGFFKTLFSVIGEQYTDTKDTFRKVNDMINDNFLPENAPPTTEATTVKDSNETTTMAPYKITRTEFNKIIRRNLRGLVRLFNIEFQDAIKQSKKTQAEYKRNVSKEISKFL